MNDTHLAPENFVALLSHGICANKRDQSSSLSRFLPWGSGYLDVTSREDCITQQIQNHKCQVGRVAGICP